MAQADAGPLCSQVQLFGHYISEEDFVEEIDLEGAACGHVTFPTTSDVELFALLAEAQAELAEANSSFDWSHACISFSLSRGSIMLTTSLRRQNVAFIDPALLALPPTSPLPQPVARRRQPDTKESKAEAASALWRVMCFALLIV